MYLQELAKLLAPENLITAPYLCKQYIDAKNFHPSCSFIVVKPTCSQTLLRIIQVAYQYTIPLIARGSGTNTTGATIPVPGSILLSFEKMNHILQIDTANRIIVTEPGVITGDLQRIVAQYGLYYPPDPASADICTIGGNVAENAGGPRALKYGVTGNYVVGLEGFYANGMPFRFGGKQYKNVAGYDLKSLLIGSEGTLAIISKIYLRLIPLPRYQWDIVATFDSYMAAIEVLQQVHQADIQPCLAEFIDQFCLKAVAQYLNKEMPNLNAVAQVIFQIDGCHKATLRHDLDKIKSICRQYHAKFIQVAMDTVEKEQIWTVRKNISQALYMIDPNKLSYDIVIPPNCIADYLQLLKKISDEYQSIVLGYGHLGDGNIHVNILQKAPHHINWIEIRKKISHRVLTSAVKMGGTITGEHGIGIKKKPYMHLVFSPQTLAMLRHIKNVFDPKNILNPGKII